MTIYATLKNYCGGGNNACTKFKYADTTNYASNQDSMENFTFELTPEKKCDGGPYMYTSDPERQKLCSQFSKKDLALYQCCNGYHGRPAWKGMATNGTLSDSSWKNPSCRDIDPTYNDPRVL